MNSGPNHRTKQTRRGQRSRRGQRWGFTFIGGTPEKLEDQVNQDKLARLVAQKQSMGEQLFTLSTTQIGDRVVIAQILSGQNMEHHLSQMGLTRGSEVQVISKTRSGSVIVCIQDEQIGLGVGMADRVMVTLVAKQ